MVNPAPAILLDIFYLPPISYFACFATGEEVILDPFSPYIKGTYRNRCLIATANGPLILSVPLRSGKYLQPFEQVKIAYDEPWQRQHWRGIRDAYKNAAFFPHYEPIFEHAFQSQPEYLLEWNLSFIFLTLKLLKLPMPYIMEAGISRDAAEIKDARKSFSFKNWNKGVNSVTIPKYVQVFEDRLGFLPDLSILDLIFCTGPEAPQILRAVRTSATDL